jgi:hypothetical protein
VNCSSGPILTDVDVPNYVAMWSTNKQCSRGKVIAACTITTFNEINPGRRCLLEHASIWPGTTPRARYCSFVKAEYTSHIQGECATCSYMLMALHLRSPV